MTVLLFLREAVCYNFVNEYIYIIANALESLGVKTVLFDSAPYLFTPPPENVLKELMSSGADAALAINAVGQQDYSLDGENIYEKMEIPFFNYIVDHPVDHQVGLKSSVKNYYVICLDRKHVKYIKKYYPNVRKVFFLPLPGAEAEKTEQIPYSEREYELIFTGAHIRLKDLEDKILQYSPAIRHLVTSHIEYMIDHRDASWEEALETLLTDMGIRVESEQEFLSYAQVAAISGRYMRAYIREEVVRYLIAADVPLHLFGVGWEELAEISGSKTVIHPPVFFKESVELCQHAKMTLNVMPMFKDACHDRIPTTMLAGALSVTDHSIYLDENLSQYVCFYDINKPWEIGDIVWQRIRDCEGSRKMALEGQKYAEEKMSQKQTALELSEIIKGVCSSL